MTGTSRDGFFTNVPFVRWCRNFRGEQRAHQPSTRSAGHDATKKQVGDSRQAASAVVCFVSMVQSNWPFVPVRYELLILRGCASRKWLMMHSEKPLVAQSRASLEHGCMTGLAARPLCATRQEQPASAVLAFEGGVRLPQSRMTQIVQSFPGALLVCSPVEEILHHGCL